LRVFDSADETAAAAAARIADAIRAKPGLVLGLAAGRTPVPVYAALRRLHAGGGADFSRVHTFNLDEFVGIPPAHPATFRRFTEVNLLDHLNVNRQRTHFLDGSATELQEECLAFERAIADAGGIDLQLLGIGVNGHIGFNEPGEALIARTHRVVLHQETRRDNADLFGGDPARVPAEALSMGIATILHAGSIMLIATGVRKAAAVAAAVRGPITTRVPASLLQTHRSVEIYLDRPAASALERGGRT
jgi:glucosamine-6-phosphate deaminase